MCSDDLSHNDKRQKSVWTNTTQRVFMFLLKTICKQSQCRMWTFASKNRSPKRFLKWQMRPAQWSGGILAHSYKTVSAQQYSWHDWCEWLSWAHATASESGWGRDSDRAIPEGGFSSVETILLLIYFYALGRCPVTSPLHCWASVGGPTGLRFPAKSW